MKKSKKYETNYALGDFTGIRGSEFLGLVVNKVK
jgi:hypothetical protein